MVHNLTARCLDVKNATLVRRELLEVFPGLLLIGVHLFLFLVIVII
jgi:hypothetical protein